MNPGAARDGMTVCVTLEVGIMGMGQTQDEERMNQQIQTECRCGKRSKRPSVAGCFFQEHHGRRFRLPGHHTPESGYRLEFFVRDSDGPVYTPLLIGTTKCGRLCREQRLIDFGMTGLPVRDEVVTPVSHSSIKGKRVA